MTRFELTRTTSSTSCSGGFGGGVGFGFHAGGGGGKSLTVCAWIADVNRKAASTPNRNAGRHNAFENPIVISTPEESSSCRQQFGVHFYTTLFRRHEP